MSVFYLDKSNELSNFSQSLPTIKKVQFLLFAFLYGFVLAQIPDENFFDYQNYITYANDSLGVLGFLLLEGTLSVFANEPIWLLVNSALSQFLDPEIVVRVIIFFSASTISWVLLVNNPRYVFWIILFLFLPQVVKNNLIHLRQGLAISIFFLGWYSKNRIRKFFLLLMAPLIHSTYFFILLLFFLNSICLKLRIAYNLRIVFYFIVTIICLLSIQWLTLFFGARQSDKFTSQTITGSGFGFIIWFLILITIITSTRKFRIKHTFEIGILIFYLGTYWFTDVYSRVFESGLLLILISGLSLNRSNRVIFCSIVLILMIMTWLLRLNTPRLGFGPTS